MDVRPSAPPVLLDGSSSSPGPDYENRCFPEAMIDCLASGWTRNRRLRGRGGSTIRGEGTNCENYARGPTRFEASEQGVDGEFPGQGACWPRLISGPATSSSIRKPSTGGDEMPHGVPLPAMPPHFMAVRRESRFRFRKIPGTDAGSSADLAQWGIFLRNHDERRWRWSTTKSSTTVTPSTAKDPR